MKTEKIIHKYMLRIEDWPRKCLCLGFFEKLEDVQTAVKRYIKNSEACQFESEGGRLHFPINQLDYDKFEVWELCDFEKKKYTYLGPIS